MKLLKKQQSSLKEEILKAQKEKDKLKEEKNNCYSISIIIEENKKR